MYLYEKQGSKIKVSRLIPNMEEIKKLKEKEVYEKLDYLTMLRAEAVYTDDFALEVLLEDMDPQTMGTKIGVNVPTFYKWYHCIKIDRDLTEQEAFASLNKLIEEPLLKTVKYLSRESVYPYFFSLEPQMYYLALTNPKYEDAEIRSDEKIRKMKGIVPITERLYNANELIKLLSEGDLEKLYASLPNGFIVENPQLLEIKETITPKIWMTNIEDMYRYGIPAGTLRDFENKLDISNEIIKRVSRK